MIRMELDNDEMSDALPTRITRNEVNDKVINQFEKKVHQHQKNNKKWKVQSWEHKNRDRSLRNMYIDLLLKKRGIFIKSSNPEDYAKKCDRAEPKEESNSVLAERLKYKRRRKELERRKRELLEAEPGKCEESKKYSEKKRKRYEKLMRKTKNSEPVMNDRLDVLLAKIQINK